MTDTSKTKSLEERIERTLSHVNSDNFCSWDNYEEAKQIITELQQENNDLKRVVEVCEKTLQKAKQEHDDEMMFATVKYEIEEALDQINAIKEMTRGRM